MFYRALDLIPVFDAVAGCVWLIVHCDGIETEAARIAAVCGDGDGGSARLIYVGSGVGDFVKVGWVGRFVRMGN